MIQAALFPDRVSHLVRGARGRPAVAREDVLMLIRANRRISLDELAVLRHRTTDTVRSQVRALVARGLVKICSLRPMIVEVSDAT